MRNKSGFSTDYFHGLNCYLNTRFFWKMLNYIDCNATAMYSVHKSAHIHSLSNAYIELTGQYFWFVRQQIASSLTTWLFHYVFFGLLNAWIPLNGCKLKQPSLRASQHEKAYQFLPQLLQRLKFSQMMEFVLTFVLINACCWKGIIYSFTNAVAFNESDHIARNIL